jgi:hypothetical protein
MEVRLGTQAGYAQYALENRADRRASASMCGVEAQALPAYPAERGPI